MLMDIILVTCESYIESVNPIAIIFLSLVIILVLTTLYGLSCQPQSSTTNYSFKVPLVPVTPMLSVMINAYLMLKLPIPTWQRFGIWMAIGLFIYFTYGIKNSTGFMTEHQKRNHLSSSLTAAPSKTSQDTQTTTSTARLSSL